jgi:hypothetical protein
MCPAAAEYDGNFTMRLADEVERLPDGSALLTAIADCAVLRQQVSVCREARLPARETR